MKLYDENFVEIEVLAQSSTPAEITLSLINRKFSADEINDYEYFACVEFGFWREVVPLDKKHLSITSLKHTFNLKLTKLKNTDGSIRFYATQKSSGQGLPKKKLYSTRYRLGLFGGSANESLLKIKLTSDLDDLLYKVETQDGEPILLVHQVEGEKYAEKHILNNELFKAGIIPDIITDIFDIIANGDGELDSEVRDRWLEFFEVVEEKTGRSPKGDDERYVKREIFANYTKSYRESFINSILSEEQEA
jgi:hypothetical protein